MLPRTSPSRLLLPLAGVAGLVTLVAWWSVPAGPEPEHVEFAHATAPGSRSGPRDPETLAAVRDRPARTSTHAEPLGQVACLEDGHASISGVVVDADGAPVAGAHVAILGAAHAADALSVRGECLTDDHGRFDVRSPKPGDGQLVAFTPGSRPASLGLAIDAGFVDLAQPLRLERGVAISGRVLADDTPLARVELEVIGPRSARRIRVGEHELARVDGRIEWGASRSTTAGDGSWSFEGLAPGRWIVRPRAFRCPRAVFPPGALAPESIDAPARDVELRIPAARLAVDVLLDGDPLAWAEVEVEYQGLRSSRRADANGRLEVDVSPNEGLALVVRAPGREPARQVVAGPRRGERREVSISAGPVAAPKPNAPSPVDRQTSFQPGI